MPTDITDIPHSNAQFATDIRAALEGYLTSATVEFRGSLVSGGFDEYSDIDLSAEVVHFLDGDFYSGLSHFLEVRYGQLSLRYDPDDREDPAAQGLRISFHALPIFWRVDLNITSSRTCPSKWPSPFPEWSVPASAFWNLVWAVKCAKRKRECMADHYVRCACEKLDWPPMGFSRGGLMRMLDHLARLDAVHPTLLSKLRAAL